MANSGTVSGPSSQEFFPSNIASRPRMASQQSNSLPSTPRQRPRVFGMTSRTPSPIHRSAQESTRPSSSESTRPVPSLRLTPTACRFMSTQTSRRRIPYTIGTDLLENKEHTVKSSLEPQEEAKLSGDMRELYERLLPPKEDQERRNEVVKKLNRIFAEEWPCKDFQISVFGSSGNLLCTRESDVDVCVIMKELETTCVLADILAKRGMQKVTCVHAKGVPIVKIWDPELRLACDLNLNNHVALTNTRMVRTYMQLDERVRPLAMIVKYWTSKRLINEASGGTLSSYTWTLLLINFLQTRNPPVLPVITLRSDDGQPREDFSKEIEEFHSSCEFPNENKETVGELLFHFFRRYGYEIDYQSAVMSVRKGKLLSKDGKGWQLATNNMLCVEEPYNTERNLGNTVDDTAFRGLHLEVRQAFERIADGQDLETKVFEQFEFPIGETKATIFERPQPHPRPILTRSHSATRGGGTGPNGRGHRHANAPRNTANGRRSSSAAAYGPNVQHHFHNGPGFIYASPDYLLRTPPQDIQAHMHSQHGFQDQLSQLSQRLSQEEQRLRAQQILLTQAQLQQTQAIAAGQSRGHTATYPGRIQGAHTYRNIRTSSAEEPPVTAPLHRPYQYGAPLDSPASVSQSPSRQGTDTNPSSPSLTPSIPFRRNFTRTTAPTVPNGAVRSQSQPARPLGPQHYRGPHFPSTATSSPQTLRQDYPFANSLNGTHLLGPFMGPYGQYYIPSQTVIEPVVPREYLGYGFGGTAQFLPAFQDQHLPIPAMYDDLHQQVRPNSPGYGAESIASSVLDTASRSPSPLDNYELAPDLQTSTSQSRVTSYLLDPAVDTRSAVNRAPLIVNGSNISPDPSGSLYQRRASDSTQHSNLQSTQAYAASTNLDQECRPNSSGVSSSQPVSGAAQVRSDRIINGFNTPPPHSSGPASGAITPVLGAKHEVPHAATLPPADVSEGNSKPTPNSHHPETNLSSSIPIRYQATPIPLELAIGPFDHLRNDPHLSSAVLSPVRETPSPSPTTNRRDRTPTTPHVNGFQSKSNDSTVVTSPLGTSIFPRAEHPPPTPFSTASASGAGLGIGILAQGSASTNAHELHNGMVGLVPSSVLSSTGSSNGVPVLANAALTTATNSWQLATSGRKNKKNRVGVNPAAGSIANPTTARGAHLTGIEVMPLNEGERKGG